ncbi:transmembrane emp24 domain-containing protein 3 isoform X2 [Anguilla rostrata]|uniref:transmembrane emp24 domain-containing protein 3 isoform X2 n=1 Tax=Anguilla anguilla TaxID=7936 RepID=UPI0015AAADAB|nr:transmembrane emp24 domain-containing protein 3 isoform X2 [Anguilla anguilla]
MRLLGIYSLMLHIALVYCTELTFVLPDNDKQCFFDDLQEGVKIDIDYQVIAGGNYDIDCFVTDPQNNVLYQEKKRQYDSFSHTTTSKGVYKVCFSNEFSTFTHKTVYLDFRAGEEAPLLPDMNRATALTQMESACLSIHEILKVVTDSQTWYRLREAQDRIRAEDLHERVSYWSIGETVILFVRLQAHLPVHVLPVITVNLQRIPGHQPPALQRSPRCQLPPVHRGSMAFDGALGQSGEAATSGRCLETDLWGIGLQEHLCFPTRDSRIL